MPYRTLAAPAAPRRSFRCWLHLCAMRADGAQGVMVCPRCGRTRAPRGDHETIELDVAIGRHNAETDVERWLFETDAWVRGGKVGPRPSPPIPGPGELVDL